MGGKGGRLYTFTLEFSKATVYGSGDLLASQENPSSITCQTSSAESGEPVRALAGRPIFYPVLVLGDVVVLFV